MSLLTELDAFYVEHRRCGELEARHLNLDAVLLSLGSISARPRAFLPVGYARRLSPAIRLITRMVEVGLVLGGLEW